jgi:hypothetical protein
MLMLARSHASALVGSVGHSLQPALSSQRLKAPLATSLGLLRPLRRFGLTDQTHAISPLGVSATSLSLCRLPSRLSLPI